MDDHSMTDNKAQEALQDKVVGQHSAQISLSRLVDMHSAWFRARNPLHRAPNALVIGPTGTGKSHAIKVVAEALHLPLVVIDSTRLVSTGANDHLTLDGVLVQLVKSARRLSTNSGPAAEKLAERGIVFLDEFDKLRYDSPSDDTAAIQRRLLQFIEGDVLDLEPGEERKPRSIETHGILFIAAGAFSGIERMKSKRRVDDSIAPEALHRIQPGDVHQYGFLHELVARLPVIIRFDALGAKELREILDHRDVSPLNFYASYFEQRGFDLVISDQTRDIIAEKAAQTKLGARGLHQELFPMLCALANEIVGMGRSKPADGALDKIEITPDRYRELKHSLPN